jgi:transcription initiation factor IIE alpha subunit
MFEFKCPHCGSEVYTCDLDEMYEDSLCLIYQCHDEDCGRTWFVEYAITQKGMMTV